MSWDAYQRHTYEVRDEYRKSTLYAFRRLNKAWRRLFVALGVSRAFDRVAEWLTA